MDTVNYATQYSKSTAISGDDVKIRRWHINFERSEFVRWPNGQWRGRVEAVKAWSLTAP
jgi:hypothetical protein